MVEKPKRRGPRKATRQHLENKATYYLARFAASRQSVRRVLMGAVRRSADHHGTDAEAGEKEVEAILDKLTGLGLLDDAAFAEARARSLRRRGTSARAVRGRLAQQGVDADLVQAALGAADAEVGGEFAAAARLARRRGLGPYRRVRAGQGDRDKDLAALARAGFSYDIARAVVAAATPEELEVLVSEAAEGDG